MPLNEQDTRYLELAMSLAVEGRGRTSPNPVVGAVIVADGRILGQGHHVAPGLDHAEVAAMKDAVSRSHGPEAAAAATVDGRRSARYAPARPYTSRSSRAAPMDAPRPARRRSLPRASLGSWSGAIDPSPKMTDGAWNYSALPGMRVDLADGDLARRVKRQNDGWRKSVTDGSTVRRLQVRHDSRRSCGDRFG